MPGFRTGGGGGFPGPRPIVSPNTVRVVCVVFPRLVVTYPPQMGPLLAQEQWIVVSHSSQAAGGAVRSYIEDVVGRHHGRPATAAEVDAALRDDPSDDLTLPTGLFLVAQQDQQVVACAGLRRLPGTEGELAQVHIVPAARGRGLGARLMGEIERLAEHHGPLRLRLDSRSDLVEARRAYERHGYREVPPFNAGSCAGHWLE